MDVELPISILLFEKYSAQIRELSNKNIKLNKTVEENYLLNKCKRALIKNGFNENEAHQYILKYAMDNHINKIEACNRLLVNNNG